MKIIKLLTAVIIFNVNIFSQNSIETKIECVAKAIKAEQSPQLDGDIFKRQSIFWNLADEKFYSKLSE